MAENKVKFGLQKCYFSKITFDSNGNIQYAAPKAFPGAVSLSLDAQGNEVENFYADDVIYYAVPGGNGGYQGDFEVARVVDDFRKDILGEKVDDNGLLVEDATSQPAPFALLCQFAGDKQNTRHVLYYCTCNRPTFGSSTKEESATPQTETLTITAIPAQFGDETYVKAKAYEDATNYANWFTTVQTPEF